MKVVSCQLVRGRDSNGKPVVWGARVVYEEGYLYRYNKDFYEPNGVLYDRIASGEKVERDGEDADQGVRG